jgi:mycothiol system anti-sigma-R factor
MSDDATHLDYYTCEQAVARLYEYLDQALPPAESEAVKRHLELCEACFHHFEFDRRLLETIRERCQTGRAPEPLRRKIADLLDQL